MLLTRAVTYSLLSGWIQCTFNGPCYGIFHFVCFFSVISCLMAFVKQVLSVCGAYLLMSVQCLLLYFYILDSFNHVSLGLFAMYTLTHLFALPLCMLLLLHSCCITHLYMSQYALHISRINFCEHWHDRQTVSDFFFLQMAYKSQALHCFAVFACLHNH